MPELRPLTLEEAASLPLPERYVAFCRGWSAIENRKPHDPETSPLASDLIDYTKYNVFNGITKFEQGAFDKVWEELKALIVLARGSSVSYVPYLRKTLKAHAYYFRSLAGEDISFKELVRETMGLKPSYFSRRTIEEQSAVCKRLFKIVTGKEFSLSAQEEFLKQRDATKMQGSEIEDEFRKNLFYFDWAKGKLGLEKVARGVRLEIKPVSVEATWTWRMTVDVKLGILGEYNTHPNARWFRGDAARLVFHEVCGHMLHYLMLQNLVLRGELPLIYGIQVTNSPFDFTDEGIGYAMLHFLFKTDPKDVVKKRYPRDLVRIFYIDELTLLRTMQLKNEQLAVIEGKKTPDEAANNYLDLEKSPLQLSIPTPEGKERFKKFVVGSNLKAANRARVYMYGHAWWMFRKIAKRLSPNNKIKFVRKIFSSPQILYDDIEELL